MNSAYDSNSYRAASTTIRVCRGLWGACMRRRGSELCSQGWPLRCSETLLSLASMSCSTVRPREGCLLVSTAASQNDKNRISSWFLVFFFRCDVSTVRPTGELRLWRGCRRHGFPGHAARRCGEDAHSSHPVLLEHSRCCSLHLQGVHPCLSRAFWKLAPLMTNIMLILQLFLLIWVQTWS